jgi:phage terminase large subunit GpA-like protein
MQHHVHKGIRTSAYRHICHPSEGYSYKAKDKPLADKHYSEACTKYHHCVLAPTADRTMMKLIVDINHFKTQIHIALARSVNETGSLSLFMPEYAAQHTLFAEHCVSEIPMWDVDPRTDKRLVIWNQIQNADNEFFDNLVGCYAALAVLNVSFDIQAGSQGETYDIGKFIQQHR